jgi:subtilisin family serine protease
MKRFNDWKITLLLAVLVLWPAQSPAKEYVLTVGNEQLRFVPQGEKGYVVKQAKPKAAISALVGTLFLEEGQVQPIGGLDHYGIWIVENDGPASRNDAAMAELIYSGAAEYVAPLFSSNGETVAVIPEIVLRVHPGVDARQVHFLCQSMALAIIKPMEFTTQEYLLQVLGPDADAVFTALENLNKVEWIEWAAPNTTSQPKLCGQLIPNDEYFPMQWHWQNTGQSGGIPGADIRAPEAWEITTGDPNIVVAVLDSGVDSNHPDLIDNLVPGYDFLDNDAQPDPALDHWFNGHGTACAGLIAAQGNNGIGVSGVTWNCKIMPIRIFGVLASGTESWITQSDIGTAFRWAATNGADIFSDSWVGGSTERPIIHSAIVDVTKSGGIGRGGKGCIVLFAAGNDSGPMTYYPPKYPEVIAVGATDHNDMRCSYSNYGPELDISAPGGSPVLPDSPALLWTILLWTTDIHGPPGISSLPGNPWSDVLDYTWFNGTSAATPVAAGVAALILSVDPNLTNTQVQYILERSAKDLGAPGRDDYYGYGRVDARAALDVVMSDLTDLNNDDQTDFKDFSCLAQYWKQNTSSADLAPIGHRDGKVDVNDLSILAKYWLIHIDIPPWQASNPNPAHLTLTVDINADLSWTAGYLASSYDVYFGKTNPPPFVRNQKETTFDPGTMAYFTGYRWRIDSVNSAGTTTGENWSFRTAGPP